MSLNIPSLIRRHMKRSPTFTATEDASQLPVSLSLSPDEKVVGWYKNPPPWLGSIVAFTSFAIYMADADRVVRICFDEIVDYETPKGKEDVTGVRLRTRDGFRFVRMAGRYGAEGRFLDVFNLIMILQVIATRTRQAD